jgi:transcriptional regulator with XRE-family HTH domain
MSTKPTQKLTRLAYEKGYTLRDLAEAMGVAYHNMQYASKTGMGIYKKAIRYLMPLPSPNPIELIKLKNRYHLTNKEVGRLLGVSADKVRRLYTGEAIFTQHLYQKTMELNLDSKKIKKAEPYININKQPPECTCPGCGDTMPVELPISVKEMGKQMLIFSRDHSNCEPHSVRKIHKRSVPKKTNTIT